MRFREFFIEDRLERYRNTSFCNAGESGFHPYSLDDVVQITGFSMTDFLGLSLQDSPNSGREDLREEIANLYPGLTSENVLVTTGTSEALFLFFSELIQPGKKVAYYAPAFQALYEIPMSLGAELCPIHISENSSLFADDWFDLDFDLGIINHPHNPTGLSFSETEWAKLMSFVESSSEFFLFDEHYRFLDFSNQTGMTNTGVISKNNVFGTGSFTKCFGMPGLRIGWLVGDKDFLSKVRAQKDYITHTVSPLSEFVALQVLKNKDRFQKNSLREVKENLDLFSQNWQKIPFLRSFVPPKAGLVGWIALEKGILSEEYSDRLWKETGVFLLPGKTFETEGYLRIGFGETPERFAKGIEAWMKMK